jgi:hypothetical protein
MGLRVGIAGDWNASDFAAFFGEADNFYEFSAVRFRILAYSPIDQSPQMLRRSAAVGQPLAVRRIQYASPGFTDLVGLGALTRELREFLQFLIVHFREREDRKLARDEQRIRIARARLELLEHFAKMRKELVIEGPLASSASVSEFLELPKFDSIAVAIMEGRITHLTEIDDV